MSNRAHRDNSDAGSLFPFLAVLLCTMGALLVLLVVLAKQAAERAVSNAIAQSETIEQPKTSVPTSEDAEEATALAQELDGVLKYQQQLKTLHTKSEERLRQEQSRLSHLEEHTRRIEHELARLSIAAQQLDATEKSQTVDQEQAESELKHLQSLITENEERLDQLREQSKGSHSYTIVPYKGPNGTYRKPIYIECRKDGVVIHPEGFHFSESDFAAPSWPGNPLAAVLRASREYLNAKAAKAGEPEPPDPYPLLLVRPDGIAAYSAARAAITSWDSDYGYEFIAGDWKLDFPELPDPMLAQVQAHAALNARANLARLARAAPSRFRAMGVGGSRSHTAGGTSGSHGYGSGGQSETPGNILSDSADGGTSDGNSLAAGGAEARYGASGSEGEGNTGLQGPDAQYGAMPGGLPGSEANGSQTASSGSEASAEGGSNGTPGGEQVAGGQGAQGTSNSGSQQNSGTAGGSVAQSGSPSQSGPGGQAGSGASSASGSSGASASGSQASSATMSFSKNKTSSIAESQGRNWAIKQGKRGAVPIRRPIEVVVRKNQIAILPSRHTSQGAEATGTTVSLNQTIDQISTEFVTALKSRIEEWGLAGNGLYWRPVLELKIGPDAKHTAYEITHLLKDSGVEVRSPEMARSGQGAASNATK
ncbi:MAG: hypothetical protein GXP26_07895 [Planctomycetes bacterium]|nr:hypothetical protein [Planctomycetota bacterium]